MATERYRFLVFADPVSGQEDEFNSVYDTQHIPDLLKVPGIVSAERCVAATESGFLASSKYLAIYTWETDDLQALEGRVRQGIETGRIGRNPHLDPTSMRAWMYRSTSTSPK